MSKNKKIAVLVVEDMPQARATVVSIMEDLGCAVFDAYNGPQALKLLQAHPEIEVLFADCAHLRLRRPEGCASPHSVRAQALASGGHR